METCTNHLLTRSAYIDRVRSRGKAREDVPSATVEGAGAVVDSGAGVDNGAGAGAGAGASVGEGAGAGSV